MASVVRTYEQERSFLEQLSPWQWRIKPGFVPGMNVPGTFYVNEDLQELVFSELQQFCRSSSQQGFLPALKQIANVAGLPGIVRHSIGLPDVHSGYGFAIGNVAAFDMSDPKAVVSPGGVGFDINCGVRLLRTNLSESDVQPVKEQLAQGLFDHIPVGVGSQGVIPTTSADLQQALEFGMDWSVREGYAWAEDKEHVRSFQAASGSICNHPPQVPSFALPHAPIPYTYLTLTSPHRRTSPGAAPRLLASAPIPYRAWSLFPLSDHACACSTAVQPRSVRSMAVCSRLTPQPSPHGPRSAACHSSAPWVLATTMRRSR